MIVSKLAQLNGAFNLLSKSIIQKRSHQLIKRTSTHYRSGAVKPKPDAMPFGFVGIICVVVPGLLLGATISKNFANFLEENELFVVQDDDDDDDDD